MTDKSEAAIEMALLERLLLLDSSPSNLTILMPMRQKTPPTAIPGAQYLRAHMLPGPGSDIAIGDRDFAQMQGILQVDAVRAVADEGDPPIVRLAQTVLDQFPRGLALHRDGFEIVILSAYRGRVILDGTAWAFIPVTIPYRAFVASGT